MNRPKVTKQTLKELRGELLSKQNSHNHSSQETDEIRSSKPNRDNEVAKHIEQELGEEMDM